MKFIGLMGLISVLLFTGCNNSDKSDENISNIESSSITDQCTPQAGIYTESYNRTTNIAGAEGYCSSMCNMQSLMDAKECLDACMLGAKDVIEGKNRQMKECPFE